MIQIANYRGIGLVSDCIKLLTYSVYSHTAALFTEDMSVIVDGKTHYIPAGSVIEAWEGGVRMASSLSDNHHSRTQVDIFALKSPLSHNDEMRVAEVLIRNIGKKYAYWNVLRFVPVVRLLMRRPIPLGYCRTHVYCSELILAAFSKCVQLIERCALWEIPPRDVPRSPLLRFVRTVWT